VSVMFRPKAVRDSVKLYTFTECCMTLWDILTENLGDQCKVVFAGLLLESARK
jgi:hypothetical protein